MTVNELMDALIGQRRVEVEAVLDAQPAPVLERFPEALTPEFLEDNIEVVENTLKNPNATVAERVAAWEINALFSAFQRAYQGQRQGRASRWARRYSHANSLASEVGVLNSQTRNIGTQVDSEFVSKILGLGLEETPSDS